MPSRRAVIRGHVQGVGFRAHVKSLARPLGIVGEVWNREDGAVETHYAHEDEAALTRFEDGLRSGPGYVSSVNVSDLGYDLVADEFFVGPTRR